LLSFAKFIILGSIKNNVGSTPLHAACYCGNAAIAKLLLSKLECYIDAQNNTNNTPLHYIIEYCSLENIDTKRKEMLEIIQLLVEADCDVSLKNNLGYTALEIATKTKAIEAEELIRNCWF